MDVNGETIGVAINCVASLAIQEIAEECDISLDEPQVGSSRLTRRAGSSMTLPRLWWGGPSTVVDDYLREVTEQLVSE